MKPTRDLTDEGREALRPTAERLAKGGVEVPPSDRANPIARPARVELQTMLDRYKARKTLEEDQLAAAYKWFALAARSKRFPKATMSWAGPVNGSGDDLADSQVSAGIQRDQGIKHLASAPKYGQHFVSIMEHVCVDDRPAEAWSVEHGMHPMRGIKTLRKALDIMCKFYGIRR